jgi:hypothetical protein
MNEAELRERYRAYFGELAAVYAWDVSKHFAAGDTTKSVTVRARVIEKMFDEIVSSLLCDALVSIFHAIFLCRLVFMLFFSFCMLNMLATRKSTI